MSIDVSKIVSALGDEAVAKCGDQVGLERAQSLRVARALAAHMGKGKDEAVRAAAADTGLTEEVIAAMLAKLVEKGAEKALEDSPLGEAVGNMKGAAADMLGKGAEGMFGKIGGMFGKK
jgi:hypothetical protein